MYSIPVQNMPDTSEDLYGRNYIRHSKQITQRTVAVYGKILFSFDRKK